MEPRPSLATLGVTDMARSRAFYERLGFTASPMSQPSVTFLSAGGVVLSHPQAGAGRLLERPLRLFRQS